MNDIHSVSGPASAQTLREFARQSGAAPRGGTETAPADQVEISELAAFLNRLAGLPDHRARKIVDIRNAIRKEAYVTGEKLDVTTERLLRDL